MTDELHPCARCARVQRTCCQRAEILVTGGDVERIRAHLGGRDDFHERRVPTDPAYVEHDPRDPEWRALTVCADGRRHMLRRRDDGDCTFLGAAGCTLPESVRPLVCRLYPWTYTAAGLDGEDPDYCPIALFGGASTSMLAVLAMAQADADRWRTRLYAELHADAGTIGGAA